MHEQTDLVESGVKFVILVGIFSLNDVSVDWGASSTVEDRKYLKIEIGIQEGPVLD